MITASNWLFHSSSNREVEVVEMLHRLLGTGNAGQRVELHDDWKITGRVVQQAEKLKFGIFESGIRHIVDQRDPEGFVAPGPY